MKRTEQPDNPEIYRQMLLDRRREVLSGLGGKFDDRARMGRVADDDQAQISHDEFISLRMNGLDYTQLRMVEEALDRLDSGDFGICLSCEEPIAPKRLAAIPWARYCVTCQEMLGADADWSAAPVGQAR
jgi:DnaK suppressor protein